MLQSKLNIAEHFLQKPNHRTFVKNLVEGVYLIARKILQEKKMKISQPLKKEPHYNTLYSLKSE